ncbi:MAG: tetratricopeptide repeat protein, partial [Caldilineaceae bacterium]|nr:tetratricopeptide repeat protein [Caldilineaceae bacterium]
MTSRDFDVATALHAHIYAITEMTPQDGEQLLTRILGEERVHPEAAAARQICTLLQNLPLAVEIAAQRLRSRPRRRLADMATRLQDTQERLDLAISDRAVRTSFLVSWESLDNEQRRIFALLGLFEGRSFAAPALAYIAELDLYTTEDRLFTLTALSLLNEEESDDETAVRYRQHPLLADFAREQLGDNRAMALRLVHYYLSFAQEERMNYAALQPEWENLMIGLQTAHALAEWQVVVDYTETLTEPWFTRARYAEARHGYALMREAAETLEDKHTLVRCLLQWGEACIEQDDYPEAEEKLQSSLKLANELQDRQAVAQSKHFLAKIALDQSNYQVAKEYLDESRQLLSELNDLPGIASTICQQAILLYRRGDLSGAQEYCQQALLVQRQENDLVGILPTLRLAADIALEQEELDSAQEYCQQALTLCQELQNRGELAATYYSLAVVARHRKEIEIARNYAHEALSLLRVFGDRKFQAVTLYEISRIATLSNNLTEAISAGEESLALLRELKENFNIVYVLRHLGELARQS